MRIPLIAGNWKMNTTIDEGIQLVNKIKEFAKDFDKEREILVCVPFTSLYAVKKAIDGTNIKLGAQNMYFEESGAYTGEISPIMLNDIGVDYVLIGHSERRQYFKEDDDLLNKKIKSALQHKIKPILCVGETLEERESNNHQSTVKAQLVNGLKGITTKDMENIVIAYEPVWAIGTGKTATSEQANEMIAYIRNTVKELFGDVSQNTIIQYGGSVKPNNAAEIMGKSEIDGALVGGASLNADDFIKIINY